MAEPNPTARTIPPTEPINPNVSTQSNNLQPQIIVQEYNSVFRTDVVLNETNYPLWSQLMEIRIGA